jgi:hypothetical protein
MSPARDVVGLYNWTSEPLEMDYATDRIGLPGKGPFVAFDYWANAFVPAFEGRLRVTLPKESCQVLAVRPIADRPQLISTSRHITQGIVDVLEEKWEPATGTLNGKSKVVGGDPYELRIVTTDRAGKVWTVESVEVSSEDKAAGVKIVQKGGAGGLRVTIETTANREVVWSIRFAH